MPINGKIASDLLRISFINKLLDEKHFFEKRGKEMIELADKHKDEELLNIYAYLESVATGRVSEQTDKKGWNEYLSEKFAIFYSNDDLFTQYLFLYEKRCHLMTFS